MEMSLPCFYAVLISTMADRKDNRQKALFFCVTGKTYFYYLTGNAAVQ